jgi:membrane protein
LLFAPFFSPGHGAAGTAVAFLIRWTLVIALLGVAVGLLVRHAPSAAQTVPWVSLGATIVIASWVLVSLVFHVYLVDVASYDSVFGSLAVVIGALAYLYVSTTVFLFGAQLDAIIRARATGVSSGTVPD